MDDNDKPKSKNTQLANALMNLSTSDSKVAQMLRNLRINAEIAGGKESGGYFGGGQIGYDFPITETSSFEPYVQGFMGKPTNQPIAGGITGAGINYRKRF
jgi:hypothetical protein